MRWSKQKKKNPKISQQTALNGVSFGAGRLLAGYIASLGLHTVHLWRDAQTTRPYTTKGFDPREKMKKIVLSELLT